jgi:hypothetical protein
LRERNLVLKRIVMLLFLVATGIGRATTVLLGPESAFIDQLEILAVAGGQQGAPPLAIRGLQAIASGKLGEFPMVPISGDVGPDALTKLDLTSSTIRSYAFRALGRIGGDDVVAFLDSFKKSDLQPESLWSNSRVALASALLATRQAPPDQVRFLESVALGDSVSSSPLVRLWAVDELCNRGSRASSQVIGEALRSLPGDVETAYERTQFCSERIELLSAFGDRDDALGSALAPEKLTNLKVVSWALEELAKSRSVRAQQHMDRFAVHVQSMGNSPAKLDLQQILASARRAVGLGRRD